MFVDVILPISMIVIGIVAFCTLIYTQIKTDNEFDELLSSIQEKLDSSKPFSLAEHYERLIQVSEEIAEEKAKNQYEPTVLWLILDGMRINEDGTIEWIKKPMYMTGIENCSVEDRLRMQYAQLQSNLATQMMNIQNQMQSQALIHSMAKNCPIYDPRPAGAELTKWGDVDGEPYYSWAQEL